MPRKLSHLLFIILLLCVNNVFAQHYKLLKKTVIGGEGGWDYLSIDQSRGHLFIAHSDRVEIYDIVRDSVIAHIAHTEGVHGVALASLEQHGFISCGKSNSVLMFDLNTFDTLKRIPVGEKPDAIIYDPASKHIFVMNGTGKNIDVLDAMTGENITTIKLAGSPEFAVPDNEGHVFVNLEDRSAIVKIDSKKNKFLSSWSLAPGEGPTGIAMDQKSQTLFSSCANEKLITINARNGKVKDIVAIGKGSDAVVFDSALGNVISSNGDGTATVITSGSDDWINASVLETIRTARGARTIALDPVTHNLYFVTAEFGPAPADQKRPPILPKTFYVMKFGLIEK